MWGLTLSITYSLLKGVLSASEIKEFKAHVSRINADYWEAKKNDDSIRPLVDRYLQYRVDLDAKL